MMWRPSSELADGVLCCFVVGFQERIDARNHLESLLFQVKTDLEDSLKGKLPAEDEEALKKAVEVRTFSQIGQPLGVGR